MPIWRFKGLPGKNCSMGARTGSRCPTASFLGPCLGEDYPMIGLPAPPPPSPWSSPQSLEGSELSISLFPMGKFMIWLYQDFFWVLFDQHAGVKMYISLYTHKNQYWCNFTYEHKKCFTNAHGSIGSLQGGETKLHLQQTIDDPVPDFVIEILITSKTQQRKKQKQTKKMSMGEIHSSLCMKHLYKEWGF